jgi:hypothetical protein
MDPNANIEEQRRIAARIVEHGPTVACACTRCVNDARRLATLVQVLDGWLCSGGSLPRTWERAK